MRAIAAVLLTVPMIGVAQAPTPDDALKAYAALEWFRAKAAERELVCIPAHQEQMLDGIVTWLHRRAVKGVCA